MPPIASYDEVKAAGSDPNILIIDVREPTELAEKGTIPGSINIPVDQVEDVLKNLSPVEFKESYGKDKPDVDFPIIVSCYAGKRGARAQEIALGLGYKNVRNYAGGFSDWEKNNK